MKNHFILFLLCLSILLSCNKPELSTSGLKYVKENYPLIPIDGLKFAAKDTTLLHELSYIGLVYADIIDRHKEAQLYILYYPENDSFALYSYSQNWNEDEYRYFLKIKEDTTSYYKEDKITKELIFFIGEYDFQRVQNELALTVFGDTTVKDDIIYYDLYSDSLSKVRGNNLPPLPTPTAEERRRWEAMQDE